MAREPMAEKVQKSASYAKSKNKAKEYINNPDKLRELIERASRKAESKKEGPIGKVLGSLQIIFRLLGAYVRGDYTKIPLQSLILIVASIAYFLMPFDLIPDFILPFGLIDDGTLLLWTIKAIGSDIAAFSAWEKAKA